MKVNHLAPLAAAFLVATVGGFVISPTASAQSKPEVACTSMKDPLTDGLQKNVSGVQDSLAEFFESGQKFSITLFSTWAEQPNSPSVYCLKYEIENDTPVVPPRKANDVLINNLWWNDAKIGMPFLPVGPSYRQSLVRVVSLSKQPQLGDTRLSAFKNIYFSGQAYKVSEYAPRNELIDRHVDSFQPVQHPVHPVGFNKPIEPFPLLHQIADLILPRVGTTYSNKLSRVSAQSDVRFDGKNMEYTLTIFHSGELKGLRAPFFEALNKAASATEMADRLKVLSADLGSISLREESAIARASIPGDEGGRPRLPYIVEQPIIVDTPIGRACFLSEAYSPIPLPPFDPKTCFSFR